MFNGEVLISWVIFTESKGEPNIKSVSKGASLACQPGQFLSATPPPTPPELRITGKDPERDPSVYVSLGTRSLHMDLVM